MDIKSFLSKFKLLVLYPGPSYLNKSLGSFCSHESELQNKLNIIKISTGVLLWDRGLEGYLRNVKFCHKFLDPHMGLFFS
jgi:hypothetical protein